METKKLTQSIEDYLEIIYNYALDRQGMRITTLSEKMGVAKPSAHNAVTKLRELGLVTQETYGLIHLTDKGKKKGEKLAKKHNVLYKFLTTVLGISAQTAENDACKIEHVISEETLQGVNTYLNAFIKKNKNK